MRGEMSKTYANPLSPRPPPPNTVILRSTPEQNIAFTVDQTHPRGSLSLKTQGIKGECRPMPPLFPGPLMEGIIAAEAGLSEGFSSQSLRVAFL